MKLFTSPPQELALVQAALNSPARTTAWVSLFTLGLGLCLTQLELRTDGAAIHPQGNILVEQDASDRRFFHERDQVIVLLTSRAGRPPLETFEGLRTLKQLHESLRELPGVDGEKVRSVASFLDAQPGFGIRTLGSFLDELPEDAEAHRELLGRMHHYPLVEGLFLSSDGRTAAFYLPVAEGHDRGELVTTLEGWLEEQQSSDFDLRLSGPVTAEVLLGRTVLHDLAWLVPIMVAVVAGLLFVSLRTLGGVVIPMVEVLLVLVWTLGAMGALGVPITLVTTIVPVVLMTMAVTDEIHLLERLQHHLAAGVAAGEASGRARLRAAVEAALGDVGWPIALTSLTTSIGFLSFLSASMAPIQHFGLFTALGILLAMGLSFTFIPALVLMLPVSWFERPEPRGARRQLHFHERLVVRRPGFAIGLGVALIAAAAPGLLRLSVQDSWVDNFDPESRLVSAERDFNAKFWGSYRFDIVMESEDTRFFQRAEGLRLMEELRSLALAAPHVGGVASHLDAFEILAEAIEQRGPVSQLPEQTQRRLVALTRFVLDRVDLDQYIDKGATHARARIFVNSADYARAEALREYLEERLPELMERHGVSHHLSGDLAVAVEVVRAIVKNQLRSVAWTLLGVGVLLLVFLLSFLRVLVLMLPVVASLPILLGAMGYAGIPLGIATTMFTALTIGVGVDFALHFSHAYRRELAVGCSTEEALRESLATTGRAIRWNAVVLSLGFLVLTLSDLKPNHNLGLLLAGAMVTCYATTLLFLPKLLSTNSPRSSVLSDKATEA
jgi:hypothetical protein